MKFLSQSSLPSADIADMFCWQTNFLDSLDLSYVVWKGNGPENKLLFFYFQVISALHYLQSQLQVIHRDVKPSNILISRNGNVKMCDFGISGYLVDSVAKTIDAGCKPYMAVRKRRERDPSRSMSSQQIPLK